MPKGVISRVPWPGKSWMPFALQPALQVLQQPVSVWVCVWAYVCVVSVCVLMCVLRECVYVCLCACVCLCVCLCVLVCVWCVRVDDGWEKLNYMCCVCVCEGSILPKFPSYHGVWWPGIMFVQKVKASALLTSCGYIIFAASQAIKSFRRACALSRTSFANLKP